MSQAWIRLVHAAVDAPQVTIFMQNQSEISLLAANLIYTEATRYVEVGATSTLILRTEERTIWQGNLDLQPNEKYTGIFVSVTDGSKLAVFRDTTEDIDLSRGLIRLINVASGYTSLDLFANDSEREDPLLTNVTFETASEYAQVSPGTYEVTATMRESNSLPTITLLVAAGSVSTIIALGPSEKSSLLLVLSDLEKDPEVVEENFLPLDFMGAWKQISSIGGCDHPRSSCEFTMLSSRLKCVSRCHNKEKKKVDEQHGWCRPHVQGKCCWNIIFDKNDAATATPNFIVHETDYQNYALVGTPDRSKMWVYSRKEKLSRDVYVKLLRKCRSWGYNVEDMKVNYHALTY